MVCLSIISSFSVSEKLYLKCSIEGKNARTTFWEILCPNDIVKIQMVRDGSIEYGNKPISRPQELAELGLKLVKNSDREMFILVSLNAKDFVNCIHLVSIGTLDKAVMSPRDVIKAALLSNAASIAFVHNLCGAAHKLCYVKFPFMGSEFIADYEKLAMTA
jgi:hypothetical protein